MHRLEYRIHPGRFAVCRLDAVSPVPAWLPNDGWSSITRTPAELSIVCEESAVPDAVKKQGGWRQIELAGPFDFALTGILASILNPLAVAGVPIFAISTFDTDWILIPGEHLEKAKRALAAAGHNEI
ncbi:MAG: ACT domain-containing protein [Bryobacteraceae bacterium]|nr:ACT domain-containing protein [Bryobacteraceae bacterium]